MSGTACGACTDAVRADRAAPDVRLDAPTASGLDPLTDAFEFLTPEQLLARSSEQRVRLQVGDALATLNEREKQCGEPCDE
ncbi:MAG: hypothetical protein R3A47_02935 [Polyangiales bacterium]